MAAKPKSFAGDEARFEQDVRRPSGQGVPETILYWTSEAEEPSAIFHAGENRAFLRERASAGPAKLLFGIIEEIDDDSSGAGACAGFA